MLIAALNKTKVDEYIGPHRLRAGHWAEIPSTLVGYLARYSDGQVDVAGNLDGSLPTQHNFMVLSGAKFHTTGGGQHPTQISKELVAMGHRVAFFQDTPIPNGHEGYPLVTFFPQQDVRYYDFHKYADAFWSRKPLGYNDVREYTQWAEAWSRQSGGRSVVVVCCPTPFFIALAEALRQVGWAVVYWSLDDWNEFQRNGDVDWYRPEYQERLCSLADGLLATAGTLSQQLGGCRQIGNGWNHRVFGRDVRVKHKKKPDDKLIVGYWGYLRGNWFDWDGLERTAREHPNWEIRLIGGLPFEVFPHTTRLTMYGNIKFIGEVPNEDLPNHANEFDVAIIPFNVDGLSAAVNPIKVYEYLASRLPVVSSYMPELEGVPGVHMYGKDGLNGVEDQLGRAIALHYYGQSSKIDWEKVDEFLAPRSWEGRTRDFISYLEELGVLGEGQ